MKKTFVIGIFLLCVFIFVGIIPACNGFVDDGKLDVVTTIFPAYDWTLSVLGEHSDEVNVINLLNSSIDMHSYSPSAEDIVNIATCDLFIYVGGESDDWVEGALKQSKNKKMVALRLLDVIGDHALEEEDKDGMQSDEDEEEDGAYDEHVWLSLRRAKIVVNAIAEALESLDADHAEDYARNAAEYGEKLDELDAEYAAAMESATNKTLIVADRFPFLYLFKDYGLDYYAAFSGCSAASQYTTETITFLINKVDELQAKYIIKTETRDDDLAQTIKNYSKNKNQTILTLNSLQSTSAADRNNGVTYLSLMRGNLDVLREAVS